ncbi:putative nuclease HARBI1 [Tripterygium wilfordii]|uniref:putative nuclease HARBI1 n=1 Tax=Tripterygium wilfordii TaxID=458696 RepID=UPI0018F7ED51|nr:putative nuclease HARBI1 [Tripterygium wilfordii]
MHEPYFQQRRDAAGRLGLSSLQKITAALRILASGVAADFMDEYVRISESTTIESVKYFAKAVISVFGPEYLRSPNRNDIELLLALNKTRGFPGMLGSIDCMYWKWKNCPTAWKGMYTGHCHEPTIILEAVASYDLWIWHAFFGLPGSHNNINVLERSHVFSELTQGRAPIVNYSINGHNYTMGYYLADGIYPSWATFLKSIPLPQTMKTKHFARCQEGVRKDVERTFGVLQSRFAIVRGPARYFETETLKEIMLACVILHNMIVEDERHLHLQPNMSFIYDQIDESPPPIEVPEDHAYELQDFIDQHFQIRDRQVYSQLQSDLIEHLWNIYSES